MITDNHNDIPAMITDALSTLIASSDSCIRTSTHSSTKNSTCTPTRATRNDVLSWAGFHADVITEVGGVNCTNSST